MQSEVCYNVSAWVPLHVCHNASKPACPDGVHTQQQKNMLRIAGRNNISSFDNVMYLRQFKKLRLVNLAGNPIAASPDYRSYVLSHIKDLTYLDYRRVIAADVASAIEQHQVLLPTYLISMIHVPY